MKSLPVLKKPITVKYLDNTDSIIHYFQQLVMSGQLKEGERLPAEEAMASNLGMPVLDISRAMFRLYLYGLVTRDTRDTYISIFNRKLKEHIFLHLLRGKPFYVHFKNYPLVNYVPVKERKPGITHSIAKDGKFKVKQAFKNNQY